jgi:hypothetical protein
VKSLTLRQCLTTDVDLQKEEEYNLKRILNYRF